MSSAGEVAIFNKTSKEGKNDAAANVKNQLWLRRHCVFISH
jgi:hypothetical protein